MPIGNRRFRCRPKHMHRHSWPSTTLRVTLVTAAALSTLGTSYPSTPTLEHVLSTAKVSARQGELANLQQPVLNYEMATSHDQFAIGYYIGRPKGIDQTFYLAVKDLRRGTWRETTVDLSGQGRTYDRAWLEFGSCSRLNIIGKNMFAFLHYSPSAGTTLQFGQDLKLQHAFYGWIEASFSNGIILYQQSRPHSRYEESDLWLFDSATGYRTKIYPVPPYGHVRREYLRRLDDLKARTGGRRYAENNIGPGISPSSLGKTVTRDGTRELAFVVSYDLMPLYPEDVQKQIVAFGATIEGLSRPRPRTDEIVRDLFSDLVKMRDSAQIVLSIFRDDQDLYAHLAAAQQKYRSDDQLDAFVRSGYWQRVDVIEGLRRVLLSLPQSTETAIYVYQFAPDWRTYHFQELPGRGITSRTALEALLAPAKK